MVVELSAHETGLNVGFKYGWCNGFKICQETDFCFPGVEVAREGKD